MLRSIELVTTRW